MVTFNDIFFSFVIFSSFLLYFEIPAIRTTNDFQLEGRYFISNAFTLF